jgi:membrane protein DedA with SNARE-associated domain/membrane-associated phospholipid phosphatase
MEHFFLDLFQTHIDVFKQFGYFTIFLLAFTESIPLIGMILPGQTIIILVGFLVKLGMFGFWLAVLTATLGALAGDYFGYIMGKYTGHHFTLMETKFYIKREQFLKTKELVTAHPLKSIFFGRLHSLTRTITPFVSGASEINVRKFLSIDLLSSFVWAFISISIGFIFGKSFEKAASFMGSFIIIGTIIAVIIIIAFNYAKKKSIKISTADIFVFISSTLSAYLLILITHNIHRGSVFGILDNRINTLRPSLHSPILDTIMITVTSVGSEIFFVFISLLLFAYLYLKRSKAAAIVTGAILSTGYVALDVVKELIHRPRPLGMLDVYGFSFPSGHATMTMIYAVLIVYFWFRWIRNIYHKNLLIGLAFATSILVGLSRIYLGVHYTSDVIAGFLFGIFYSTFGIVIYKAIRLYISRTKKDHESPLP